MVPWILVPAALLEFALIASLVRKARHATPSIGARTPYVAPLCGARSVSWKAARPLACWPV